MLRYRKRNHPINIRSKHARKTRKYTRGMRCSNHPSSNQAFPLLISYQFCGFWKLSFNIFTQVFLQVIWEKENTSSTTGWKLWKLCFKSQDIKLKKGQKLDQNLPWYSTALNWKYQKHTHSPPALQFLWPFFVVLFSHFPINCSTFFLLHCGNPHGQSRYIPSIEKGDGPHDWAFYEPHPCW